MTCSAGNIFQPVPKILGFVFSARKEIKGDSYIIREMGDQDVIHNHKKVINHLDHTSRMMYIGPDVVVHVNHIELDTVIPSTKTWIKKGSCEKRQRSTKLESCTKVKFPACARLS